LVTIHSAISGHRTAEARVEHLAIVERQAFLLPPFPDLKVIRMVPRSMIDHDATSELSTSDVPSEVRALDPTDVTAMVAVLA
jgi:hypothetical protein